MPTYYATMPSPVGELVIIGDDKAITHICLQGEKDAIAIGRDWRENARVAPIALALAQLNEYFAAKRTAFSLPLSTRGTAFEQRVWDELLRIPHGETRTYGEIARRVGNPKAARAVGLACGKNPIAIVVPCHRVIGAGGALTGYAGGLARKRILLRLEGAISHRGHTTVNDNDLPRDIRSTL